LFRSFRNCFAALHDFAAYQKASEHFRARKVTRPKLPADLAKDLDEAVVGEERAVLGTDLARSLLEWSGVPLAGDTVVGSAAAAVKAADSFGYPVVMKIASPDIAHKSDVGLVKLGVSSPKDVRSTYTDFLERASALKPKPEIEGVQIQQQISGGTEMIVGLTHDPLLGHVLLVGTGGVFAEVFKDVAVRPLPVDRRDVEEMVASLKGSELLDGARGRQKADTKALVSVALAVARLGAACGDRLAELDLNPVVVHDRGDGAVAVDMLLIAQPHHSDS
jgi:acyl-CoA synthetase (NDP forming)